VSLQDWLKNAWVTAHKSSAHEIKGLLALVERDLLDCRTSELSADWRFNIAYNAALEAATAALAAALRMPSGGGRPLHGNSSGN